MYKAAFFFICAVMNLFCNASHKTIHGTSLTELAGSAHLLALGALFLALLYFGSIAISLVLEKYASIPQTAGMLISGIILGPSGLQMAQLFNGSLQLLQEAHVYSIDQYDFIFQIFTAVCSLFAVSWLMWLAGHETDLNKVKSVGFIAVAAGTLGAIVPFVLCALIMPLFGVSSLGACSLGLMFAATSISIPVALLVSLNKMNTRPARATLAAAVVDDIIAVIMVSVFFSIMSSGSLTGSSQVLYTLVTMSLGLCAMLGFGFYLLPRIYRYARLFHAEASLYVGIVTMFLFYACAELCIGLAGITGAYFAGFFHARNADFTLEHAISPFVTRIFLPLFLVGVGLQLDVSQLSLWQWLVVGVLILIAVISKVIACSGVIGIENYRVKKHLRWSLSENLVFGFSMVARGEVGLVVASLVRSAGMIDESWYAASVVAIIFTTLLTPLCVSFVFSYTGEDREESLPAFSSMEQVEQSLLNEGISIERDETGSSVILFEGRRLVLKNRNDIYSLVGKHPQVGNCVRLLEKRARNQDRSAL